MSGKYLKFKAKHRKDAFELDVNVDIALDGVTAVFGPSGSGKTTFLRLIAGLEKATLGQIGLGDDVWADTAYRIHAPAYKRPIGLVFQTGVLLPGRSVEGNLKFAETRRRSKSPMHSREEVTKAFDINDLLTQSADTLSGGERQRVALAQAVLADPDLLLLDEPLAGLDRTRKRQILPYLKRLNTQFAMPILYVSHDLEEVGWIADRVLALENGKCVGYGRPEDIIADLSFAHKSTENQIGSMIYGEVQKVDQAYQMVHVSVGKDLVRLPLSVETQPNTPLRAFIHADDVALAKTRPEGLSMQNCLEGEITQIVEEFETGFCQIQLKCDACVLISRITKLSVESLSLSTGARAFALFKTGRKIG